MQFVWSHRVFRILQIPPVTRIDRFFTVVPCLCKHLVMVTYSVFTVSEVLLHSIPPAILLCLHIKQHRKKEKLYAETKGQEGNDRRNEYCLILDEFKVQREDPHHNAENTERDTKDVEEHQRVKPHNDVLHLQPPEEILQEKPREPHDVTAVLDLRPLKPIARRMRDVHHAESVDVEPHEDIVAVAVPRVDGVERDRLERPRRDRRVAVLWVDQLPVA